MAEYRIEFSIQRADDGDEEFMEIGFGSSGAHDDLKAATFAVDSQVTNWLWETTGEMPDPDEIRAEIETTP